MCKHPTEALMGTADGIVCRACGSRFKSFLELCAGNGSAAEIPPEPKTEAQAPDKPKRKRTKKEATTL